MRQVLDALLFGDMLRTSLESSQADMQEFDQLASDPRKQEQEKQEVCRLAA